MAHTKPQPAGATKLSEPAAASRIPPAGGCRSRPSGAQGPPCGARLSHSAAGRRQKHFSRPAKPPKLRTYWGKVLCLDNLIDKPVEGLQEGSCSRAGGPAVAVAGALHLPLRADTRYAASRCGCEKLAAKLRYQLAEVHAGRSRLKGTLSSIHRPACSTRAVACPKTRARDSSTNGRLH